MSIARAAIACLGAGRMGRGIAVAFAYAGYPVIMVDVKARAAEQFVSLQAEALGEISKTLASMARFGLLTDRDAKTVISRVSMVPRANMAAALANSEIVFEAVPEVVDLKREVLAAASNHTGRETIIASTTSTILVDDISGRVERSAKTAASLVRLLERLPQQPDWFTSEATSVNLQNLLKRDMDSSAEIAEGWLARLKSHLARLGCANLPDHLKDDSA